MGYELLQVRVPSLCKVIHGLVSYCNQYQLPLTSLDYTAKKNVNLFAQLKSCIYICNLRVA